MAEKLSGEDESFKYMVKNIGVPILEKLGHQAEEVEFKNVELIPKAKDKKYMDVLCSVDGKYNLNIEPQSTPIYETKWKICTNTGHTPNVKIIFHSKPVCWLHTIQIMGLGHMKLTNRSISILISSSPKK